MPCLPTVPIARFVYNIDNNEYKVKQTISGYFARNSNAPVSHGHVCLLLQLPVKIKRDSGGFKPPLNVAHKNSD